MLLSNTSFTLLTNSIKPIHIHTIPQMRFLFKLSTLQPISHTQTSYWNIYNGDNKCRDRNDVHASSLFVHAIAVARFNGKYTRIKIVLNNLFVGLLFTSPIKSLAVSSITTLVKSYYFWNSTKFILKLPPTSPLSNKS